MFAGFRYQGCTGLYCSPIKRCKSASITIMLCHSQTRRITTKERLPAGLIAISSHHTLKSRVGRCFSPKGYFPQTFLQSARNFAKHSSLCSQEFDTIFSLPTKNRRNQLGTSTSHSLTTLAQHIRSLKSYPVSSNQSSRLHSLHINS